MCVLCLVIVCVFFLFKQKTAYEMLISDWSSDVCYSDLQTDDGQSTSATAVRALIMNLVADESGAKPLSDNQIAVRLAEQGVVIARRTVAKYREEFGRESCWERVCRYV